MTQLKRPFSTCVRGDLWFPATVTYIGTENGKRVDQEDLKVTVASLLLH